MSSKIAKSLFRVVVVLMPLMMNGLYANEITLEQLGVEQNEKFVKREYKPTKNTYNYWRALGMGAAVGTIAYAVAPDPAENKLLNLGLFFSVTFAGSVFYDYQTQGPNQIESIRDQSKREILNALP